MRDSGGDAARWTFVIYAGVVLVVAVAVALVWLASGLNSQAPNWQARSIDAVVGASNGKVLEVTVSHEDCRTGDPRVTLDERRADLVVLSAEYDASGDCNDVGLETTIGVQLERTLGDRIIRVVTPRPGVVCNIQGADSDRCVDSESPR